MQKDLSQEEVQPFLDSVADFAKVSDDTPLNRSLLAQMKVFGGLALQMRGQHSSALALFHEAAAIFEGLADQTQLALVYEYIGVAHHDGSQYDETMKWYAKSLAIREQAHDGMGMASIFACMGRAHRMRGEHAAALDLIARAAGIYERLGHEKGLCNAYTETGLVRFAQGQYDEALTWLTEALPMAERVESKANLAALYTNMGLIQGKRGHMAEALDWHRKALDLTELLGDRSGAARCRVTMGRLHSHHGEHAEALSHFRAALHIYEEVGDEAHQAELHNDIGTLHLSSGAYGEALRCLEKSLAIDRRRGRRSGVAISAYNLGLVHQTCGEPARAIERYREASAILEELGDEEHLATVFGALGAACDSLDDNDAALVWQHKGLAIRERLSDRGALARAHGNIAHSYIMRAFTPGAMRESIMSAFGHLQQAAAIFAELGDEEGLASAYNTVGSLTQYVSRDYDEAARLYETALSLAQKGRDPDTERLYERNLGALYATDLHDYAKAFPHLQRAIDLLESVRSRIGVEDIQTSYLGKRQGVYETMVVTCLALDRPEEALAYAERSRSRALIDLLHSARLTLGGADQGLYDRKTELERLISMIERQLHGSQGASSERGWPSTAAQRPSVETPAMRIAEREKLRAKLSDADAELARINRAIKESATQWASLTTVLPVGFQTIRAQLRSGAFDTGEHPLLIEYFLAGEEVIAFLVPAYDGPPRLTVTRLPFSSRDELQSWLAAFRATLEGLMDDTWDDLATVHERLVAPVLSLVHLWPPEQQPTLLQFVPHGPLHAIPLHAAYDAEHGRYLIEDYAVAYTPTASLLHYWQTTWMRARAKADANVLVYGNPTGDLLSAEAEAIAVARIWSTEPFLRDAARKASLFEAGSAAVRDKTVLHLACHGAFDSVNPINTHLQLAGGERLDLNDILALPLEDATLVVLSACESAVSEAGRGEELVGLTRSFLYAGTPSVIASLWNVNDEASAWMMTSFYRHWRGGAGLAPRNKAQALRAAMVAYLNEFRGTTGVREHQHKPASSHPYFWAAYVLVGDWAGGPADPLVAHPAAHQASRSIKAESVSGQETASAVRSPGFEGKG